MYKELLSKIKEYDQITIFRHIRPDGDAMFSALAMYQFIKDNFKDKKVKMAGNDKYDIISKNDKVSDDYINDSLAIIVDTSNIDRVDDKRFINCLYTIKIDHHPSEEHFGKLNIESTSKAACAELLGEIFLSKEFSKCILSNKVCKYLYCGMLTDSMGFSTTSTTPNTLKIAYELAQIGKLKIDELNRYVFNEDIDKFKKVSLIRNYLQTNDHLGYIVLDKKQLKKIGMLAKDARVNIDEIASIKEFNVWAFFTQDEDGLYDGSLRSIRGYEIRNLAIKYNGGGHANASGVNKLNLQQVNDLLTELAILSNA